VKEGSKKAVKDNKKDKVTFDFKEKGKKPVTTSGILQFSMTGEHINVEKIRELLS
jgi:hypothetical protein